MDDPLWVSWFHSCENNLHAYIINLTSLPFFQLKLGWGVIYDDLERCERIDATVSTSVHYCQQGEPMFC
jgi:hypothetical protein